MSSDHNHHRDFCNSLYFTSNALARVTNRMAEDEFRVTGLSPSQGFIIMLVNKYPGISPMELSRKMHLRPSTITRLVDRMITKKLLIKYDEGKRMYIHPTELGKSKDSDVRYVWMKLEDQFGQLFGKMNLSAFTDQIYNSAILLEEEIEENS